MCLWLESLFSLKFPTTNFKRLLLAGPFEGPKQRSPGENIDVNFRRQQGMRHDSPIVYPRTGVWGRGFYKQQSAKINLIDCTVFLRSTFDVWRRFCSIQVFEFSKKNTNKFLRKKFTLTCVLSVDPWLINKQLCPCFKCWQGHMEKKRRTIFLGSRNVKDPPAIMLSNANAN